MKNKIMLCAIFCLPIIAMEEQKTSISHLIDTPEKIYEYTARAEDFLPQDLSNLKNITDLSAKSGLIAQMLSKRAPGALVTVIRSPFTPFDLSELKQNKNIFLIDQSTSIDLQHATSPQLAVLYGGDLGYIADKKAKISDIVKNMNQDSHFTFSSPIKNDNPLVKAFKDLKEDSPWQKTLEKIDVNAIWHPTTSDELKQMVADAGLKVIAHKEYREPVVFANKDIFKQFLMAVTHSIKNQMGNTEIFKDHSDFTCYIDNLAQTYFKYEPIRADGSILYDIQEDFYMTQKN